TPHCTGMATSPTRLVGATASAKVVRNHDALVRVEPHDAVLHVRLFGGARARLDDAEDQSASSRVGLMTARQRQTVDVHPGGERDRKCQPKAHVHDCED